MRRAATAALLLAVTAAAAAPPPGAEDAASAKAALQKLADFAGDWKATGKAKTGGKETVWTEAVAVNWKFQGADAWLAVTAESGKSVPAGEVRYDAVGKAYTFTTTAAGQAAVVYTGNLVKGNLVLTAKDATTGDVTRLTVYTLADGARLVVKAEAQAKGKGPFTDVYQLAGTKAGEAFAGGPKKPECLITGGLGTIAVSYNGKTYYVCCSGCRDEFNSDPKKYADAFDKKK